MDEGIEQRLRDRIRVVPKEAFGSCDVEARCAAISHVEGGRHVVHKSRRVEGGRYLEAAILHSPDSDSFRLHCFDVNSVVPSTLRSRLTKAGFHDNNHNVRSTKEPRV